MNDHRPSPRFAAILARLRANNVRLRHLRDRPEPPPERVPSQQAFQLYEEALAWRKRAEHCRHTGNTDEASGADHMAHVFIDPRDLALILDRARETKWQVEPIA